MKRIALFTVIALLICMMGACDRPEYRRLQRAEAVMESAPDSALAILDSIDTASLTRASERALYALLLTQGRIKTYEVLTDDSLISTAVRYYEDHGPDSNLMKSLFYQAEILFSRGELNKSLENQLNSLELAKDLNANYWIAKSSEAVADLFNHAYSDAQAVKYSKDAVKYYGLAGRIRNHRFALSDMATYYGNIGNFDLCFRIFDSISQIASKEDPALFSYVLTQEYTFCFHTRNYSKADSIFRILKNLDHDFESNFNVRISRFILGIERDSDYVESDILWYSRTDSFDMEKKGLSYMLLSAYYEKNNDLIKSKRYSDSIHIIEKNICDSLIKESLVSYQRDLYGKKADEELQRTKQQKKNFIVACTLFLIVSFIIIVFYKYRLKIKNLEIDSRIKDILLLSEEKRQLFNRNIVLQNTLNSNQHSIEILNRQNAIQQQQLSGFDNIIRMENEKSEELRHSIERLYKTKWNTLNILCNKYFEQSHSEKSRLKIVEALENEVNKMNSDESMLLMEDEVNKYMDNIISKLKTQLPKLKQDNIRLLTLIYAGFTTKTICILLKISQNYFYLKKHRLIRRIQESDAPDKELFIEKML